MLEWMSSILKVVPDKYTLNVQKTNYNFMFLEIELYATYTILQINRLFWRNETFYITVLHITIFLYYSEFKNWNVN